MTSAPCHPPPSSSTSSCTLVISQSDCRGESTHPSARSRLRANDFCKQDRERVRASRLQTWRNRKDIMVPPFELPLLHPLPPLSSLARLFVPRVLYSPVFAFLLRRPKTSPLPGGGASPRLILDSSLLFSPSPSACAAFHSWRFSLQILFT